MAKFVTCSLFVLPPRCAKRHAPDSFVIHSLSGTLKKYRVFFILKRDKTNVRPISMASCVRMVLERMINIRISWWLENNQKFSETLWILAKQGLHRQRSNTNDRNNKSVWRTEHGIGPIPQH
jgi:hypothetical protein